ncbi:hypothetical protein U0070_002345 [Myodes glareolus]|uniref:Immunoglobulin I-set domain-containing protein n=1 Tax=Myodes glareolus TaxID=447135 RepID=A0AAW0IWZ9_MYOGA
MAVAQRTEKDREEGPETLGQQQLLRYTSTLTLNRVKPLEAGQYSLMVHNKAGWNNVTFELTLR